jgi:hypothetical protein
MTSNVTTGTPSAWSEAVDLAELRDALLVLGFDASVRAIARRRETSSGRVGDLLKIRSAFPTSVVEAIGTLENNDSTADESIEEIGSRYLARLSFRALRRLSSFRWRERVLEVRRLVQTQGSPVPTPRLEQVSTSTTTTVRRRRRTRSRLAAIGGVPVTIAVSN